MSDPGIAPPTTGRRSCSWFPRPTRLGLEVQVVTARYELREATELANRLLIEAPRPTAVFCFRDSIAYGVWRAAAPGAGRVADPPAALSVIGYDDHPHLDAAQAAADELQRWGSKRLIEVAVQMLLAAMEGDASVRRRVVIAPELRSAAPPIMPPGA